MAKIKIGLKSGNTIDISCKNFSVVKNSDNTILEIKWESVTKPAKILYLHLHSIESVTQL